MAFGRDGGGVGSVKKDGWGVELRLVEKRHWVR